MKKEEADFIGSMNMCDEISNEAYKKIMCNCEVEESQPCENCISRQAVLDKKELVELEDGQSFYCINPKDVETLPPVTPQPRTGKWIDDKCSVCGKGIETLIDSPEWYKNEEPNFCPFCGIKIERAEE